MILSHMITLLLYMKILEPAFFFFAESDCPLFVFFAKNSVMVAIAGYGMDQAGKGIKDCRNS